MNELRLLLLNLVFAAAGVGALFALDVAPTLADLRRRIGLAYLSGIATVGIGLAVLALFRVSPGWLPVLAITAGVLLAGSARLHVNVRRGRMPTPVPTVANEAPGPVVWAVVAASIAVVVYAAFTFAVMPSVRWDAWSIWALKAQLLLAHRGADPSIFGDQSGVYLRHPEYPLLMPSLLAAGFSSMGTIDVQVIHLQFLLFAVAGVLAMWTLLRGRTSTLLTAAVMLAVLVVPGVMIELLSGYVDVPAALFVACGSLACAVWLRDDEKWALHAAALLLGAATLTKNESLLYVSATYIALLLVASSRRRPVLLAAAGSALVYLPWKVFLTVHDIHPEDYRVGDSVDIGYVGARIDRGPIALHALVDSLFSQAQWSLLVPLGILGLVLGALRGRGRLTLFLAVSQLFVLAGLTWIYVISPVEIHEYLKVTTDRIIAGIVLTLVAATPLLLSGPEQAPSRAAER